MSNELEGVVARKVSKNARHGDDEQAGYPWTLERDISKTHKRYEPI